MKIEIFQILKHINVIHIKLHGKLSIEQYEKIKYQIFSTSMENIYYIHSNCNIKITENIINSLNVNILNLKNENGYIRKLSESILYLRMI